MDKNNFLKLLRRYLKGEATVEEQRFLISYYNLFQNEPDVVSLLSEQDRAFLKDEIKASIWNNIDKANLTAKKEKSILRYRILAAAAVLVVITTYGILTNKQGGPSRQVAKTIVVSNNKHKESSIHLPDGSTLILGAGSKVRYSSLFNSLPKRDIYLDGNAFFDVVHNPSKPFTVYSGDLKTIVLGTAFSVEAFSWYKDIIVTVKRGKVAVANQYKVQGTITPDQQIIYNKSKALSTQSIVDANHYYNWNGKNLIFDDITVADAAEILEKKFNVKISFSNEVVKSKRLTATFNNDELLEPIVKSICEFYEASYSINKTKDQILIRSLNRKI